MMSNPHWRNGTCFRCVWNSEGNFAGQEALFLGISRLTILKPSGSGVVC